MEFSDQISEIFLLIQGGVSVERCDDSLSNRISISGDYNSHECGITVTQLQVEDAGTWECEVRTTFYFYSFRDFCTDGGIQVW